VPSSLQVFLSHSSVDKELARRLAKDLQAANINVWLDQWEIEVGEAFVQSIAKGIDEADFVIVLLTRQSVASDWVDREWRQKVEAEAQTQRVGVIPVRGEPCEIPDFLAQRSFADISGGSYPRGFNYLLEMLRHYSGADIPLPKPMKSPNPLTEDGEATTHHLPIVTPITLEVGQALIPLFEPDAQGHTRTLHELAPDMRDRLQAALGFPFPGVRVRGNESDMPPDAALILIDEIPELMLTIDPHRVLVEASPDQLATLHITGEANVDPFTNAPLHWIAERDRPTATAAGLFTWDAAEYLFQVLEHLLRSRAAEFLHIDVAQWLVEVVEQTNPELVARTVPQTVSWYDLTEVLQRLVEEDIGVGDMAAILEALSQTTASPPDPVVLAEQARHALSPYITAKVIPTGEVLPVLTLAAEIEAQVQAAIQFTPRGSYLALEPDVTQTILAAIRTTIETLDIATGHPAILTIWEIRRYIRKLVELEFPWLPVLSPQDLAPDAPLQPVAAVTLGAGVDTPIPP
jgi:type III secretory pathway component EscV